MSWDTIVPRIPHVFDAIFGHLDLQDRLSAASTCRQWEAAVFGASSRFAKDIALNVTYDRYSTPSNRAYQSVTVKPWIWGRRKFQLSLRVLETMNGACPIRWARFDGRFADWSISPSDLMAYGRIFSNLQELELTLTLKTFWDEGWDQTFENLGGLSVVKLTGGHGRVMSSVRTYCRGLKKLTLVQFALTKPLGQLLDFPELEELVIEDLDVSPSSLELQSGESQLVYNNLKHLTFLISYCASFVHLTRLATTIKAPELQSARLSEILYRFVRIEAGGDFHDLTLNVTSYSPSDFTPSIIFRNDLSSVTRVTIEAFSMKGYVDAVMGWVKDHCGNVNDLVFDQEPSPQIHQQITDYAVQEMATMPKIVYNANEFQKSCFSLERRAARLVATNHGNQINLNNFPVNPNFNWN